MRNVVTLSVVTLVAALALSACGNSANKRARTPAELTAAEPPPYSQDIDLSRPAWQRGPSARGGLDRLP